MPSAKICARDGMAWAMALMVATTSAGSVELAAINAAIAVMSSAGMEQRMMRTGCESLSNVTGDGVAALGAPED